MSNRNRRKKPSRANKKVHPGGDGFITRLFASTKGTAQAEEENDWYLDSPDVRLTRVFAIVLILHVVAVGGILAFKMIEKASGPQEVASRSIAAAQSATPVSAKPVPAIAAVAAPAPAAVAPMHEEIVEQPVVVPHPSSKDHLEYRVRASDSLASIASEQEVSVEDIRRLNHLNNGDKIHPGKWLTIPRTGDRVEAPAVATATRKPALIAASITPATEAPAAKKAVASSSNSYVVSAGDTFYGISKKFGVSYQEIMSANGIDSPQGLRTGMTLNIPSN